MQSSKKRFVRDTKFFACYKGFILELLVQGHVRKCDSASSQGKFGTYHIREYIMQVKVKFVLSLIVAPRTNGFP